MRNLTLYPITPDEVILILEEALKPYMPPCGIIGGIQPKVLNDMIISCRDDPEWFNMTFGAKSGYSDYR